MNRSEKGNIAPLVVVSALLLLTVLSFAIDQGLAYGQKLKQEDVLEQMRLTCMDAAFGLSLKNSENPGQDIAEKALQVARDEGFSGSVEVWFYEKPRAEVSTATRFWAIGFQLQEESPTIFAKGWGLASIPVATWKVVTAEPYASKKVWRPKSDVCGKYTCQAGVSQLTFTQMGQLQDFPEEMIRALGQ